MSQPALKFTPALPPEAEITTHAVNALANAALHTFPFRHWLLDSVLPPEGCQALVALPIPPAEAHDMSGKRDSRNDLRRFFNPEMRNRHGIADSIARAFQSASLVNALEKLCGVSLNHTYLRIEYCQDCNGFWLEPHRDIPEKQVTLQIYLNTGDDTAILGTDMYDAGKTPVARAPAHMNQGMLFVPSDPDSFHGFEKRSFKGVRRSLIINYVTDDWRARHELSFPDNKIAVEP